MIAAELDPTIHDSTAGSIIVKQAAAQIRNSQFLLKEIEKINDIYSNVSILYFGKSFNKKMDTPFGEFENDLFVEASTNYFSTQKGKAPLIVKNDGTNFGIKFLRENCKLIVLAVGDNCDNISGKQGIEGEHQQIDGYAKMPQRLWTIAANGCRALPGKCKIFFNPLFLGNIFYY